MSSSDSDSESQSSVAVPKPEALENALRGTVKKVFASGDLDGLTVKRVRLATEKALGLQEGFFKADKHWKQRSDEIIKDEVEIQDNPTSEKPTKPSPQKKPAKRTSKSETQPASKRHKRNVVSESEEEPESPPSKASEPDEEDEREDDIQDQDPSPVPKSDEEKENAEGSESEMSVLIDEEPKPKAKSKSKKNPSERSQEKPKKKASGKSKETPDAADPDQAEIKRLQGWLIKCGIRKMWFRELAPYDTPKAKIRHLKEMLKDAGMEGRYSLDKANRIREERELKADLEMVQEGAKRWGKGGESADEASEGARPRRRLARGFKKLDFLAQGDEESD